MKMGAAPGYRGLPSWIRVIFQFPLTKIVVALVIVAGSVQSFQAVVDLFQDGEGISKYLSMLSWSLSIPLAFVAYYAFGRFYENRVVTELTFSKAFREFGIGGVLGALLMIIIICIIWISGNYYINAYNGLTFLALPFFHYTYTAVYEELIFRGILFRLIEESLGSWIALAISGLIFGFAHASVPNATLYSNFAIAIQGGVIFSAAFMFTRRLWFTMGIHFAWNFTQVGVFGIEVSGKDGMGVLESKLSNSGIISGGELGLETSLVTFIVVLVVGFYLLWRSFQKEHYIRPYWRKTAS